MIAQSYGQWRYDGPGPLHTEDERIEDPAPSMVATADAVRHLESAVTAAGGTALRFGIFNGPGTGFEYLLQMPIFGDGSGVWSFIHVDDAAAATLAAIEHDKPGVYNIADDRPMAVAEWLPALAEPTAASAARRRARVVRVHAHADPGPLEREGEARARLEPAPRQRC